MYPKVKVRQEEEEEEDPQEFQRIYLKDFQSPSNSPQHKHGYNYIPPLVRVPKSPPISISDTKIPSKAGKVDKKKVVEGNKVNKKVAAEAIKPTSVLPPRDVLSSPENDMMLGNKNKTKATKTSGLKNHNTHVKCKKSYEHEKKTSSWSWKP